MTRTSINYQSNPPRVTIDVVTSQIGLGLVELLQSSHVVFMAVLSMLCSPHEGASCLLALLADNDLTLTVTITCVINFAAVGE